MRTNLGIALAGVAATVAPLGANASIVSVADLEKSIAYGESYSLPGVPDILFGWSPNRKITSIGSDSRFGWVSDPGDSFDGAGVVVGAGAGEYLPSRNEILLFGGTYSGTEIDSGYMGLSFVLNDGTHYGWVDLTVTGNQIAPTMTIHGYGYEDVAGISIATGATGSSVPEPGTLALAAAGALAAVGAGGAGGARRRKNASH